MSKLLIGYCIGTALLACACQVAYAAPWGSRSDPSYYLGKDYTGDWEGALESLRSGTRGYMGGQLPRTKESNKPATTKRQRPPACC